VGMPWYYWSGAKIWVLPGTYEPFTIPQNRCDIDIEAWGAGSDTVIVAEPTDAACITVAGHRNRIAGFRFAGGVPITGVGIALVGTGNTMENNRFETANRYSIATTAADNRILDGAENSQKTAYTVGVGPSRADFIGTDELPIQAAVDAADADPHIKRVIIGAGTYTLTAPVVVPAGLTIIGNGYSTEIVGTGVPATPAFQLLGDNHTISGIHFDNFSNSLEGPAAGVFAYGNWLTSASISGLVTGSVADNL